MHVLDALAAIPGLVVLVQQSPDTPHREPGGKRRKVIGSPMPSQVACRDMLDTLQRRLAEAVRVAVEEMRSCDQWEPEPDDPPTWAGDCRFLIDVRQWWESDQFACDWISESVLSIHTQLSAWIGDRTRERTWTCPECSGTMHRDHYLDEGEQLACSRCGTILEAEDVVEQAPMPLPDIARIIGIPERTARSWAPLVLPVSRHTPTPRNPALYRLGDFAKLAKVIRSN